MDYQDLASHIKTARKDAGISQQVLAANIGISRATLNALENGRSSDIGVRKVMKILDYLGQEITIIEKSPFPTFEELRDEQ